MRIVQRNARDESRTIEPGASHLVRMLDGHRQPAAAQYNVFDHESLPLFRSSYEQSIRGKCPDSCRAGGYRTQKLHSAETKWSSIRIERIRIKRMRIEPEWSGTRAVCYTETIHDCEGASVHAVKQRRDSVSPRGNPVRSSICAADCSRFCACTRTARRSSSISSRRGRRSPIIPSSARIRTSARPSRSRLRKRKSSPRPNGTAGSRKIPPSAGTSRCSCRTSCA